MKNTLLITTALIGALSAMEDTVYPVHITKQPPASQATLHRALSEFAIPSVNKSKEERQLLGRFISYILTTNFDMFSFTLEKERLYEQESDHLHVHTPLVKFDDWGNARSRPVSPQPVSTKTSPMPTPALSAAPPNSPMSPTLSLELSNINFQMIHPID